MANLQESDWRNCPAICSLVETMLDVWPEHAKYLRSRFSNNSAEFLTRTEALAQRVLQLVGGQLRTYCEDYRWMCANYMEEQIHFQRHGAYRLSRFEDVDREIYSNPAYMQRYVHGLLLSEVFWINHATAIDLFRTQFLPAIALGGRYLEVGPGHGLFMYFAAQEPRLGSLMGWDISQTSIAETQHALTQLSVPAARYQLIRQDLFDTNFPPDSFDAVVISEVLEHLERPDAALRALHRVMCAGGRIFINAPVNAPAPDHIYLWRTTDALADLVRACGFTIEQEHYLPVAGRSLEYCRKYNLDISCVFIARKQG